MLIVFYGLLVYSREYYFFWLVTLHLLKLSERNYAYVPKCRYSSHEYTGSNRYFV